MNHLIKQQSAKICQETNFALETGLPLALLRISVKPWSKEGLSPFEMLYERPYQTQYRGEDINQIGEGYLRWYIKTLGK